MDCSDPPVTVNCVCPLALPVGPVAVMVVLPVPLAVAKPVAETLATLFEAEVHVIRFVRSSGGELLLVAVNC